MSGQQDTISEHTAALFAVAHQLSAQALQLRLQVQREADRGFVTIPINKIERATVDLMEQVGDVVGEVKALIVSLGGDPDELS
jgi:hypothetical protein